MADTEQMIDALDGRVRRREGRRAFFKAAVGAAAVGAGAFVVSTAADAQTVTDADVLNFALNLEYLEANFYSYAVFGAPLGGMINGISTATDGMGTPGAATGGRKVVFTDPLVAQYAKEIAIDEINHVNFLRTALGSAKVAQPQIDVGTAAGGAFSSAARAAGVISGATATFDPYSSDENFLLGSFIFEDVGVTAYKGASTLLTNKGYLEAAAGILAVEAYHASIVRTTLYRKGTAMPALITNAGKISAARDSLDGTTMLDQGIAPTGSGEETTSNIVPLDKDGLAYSRSTGQVLNIVYLNNKQVTAGGFFPMGVNGTVKTSAAN